MLAFRVQGLPATTSIAMSNPCIKAQRSVDQRKGGSNRRGRQGLPSGTSFLTSGTNVCPIHRTIRPASSHRSKKPFLERRYDGATLPEHVEKALPNEPFVSSHQDSRICSRLCTNLFASQAARVALLATPLLQSQHAPASEATPQAYKSRCMAHSPAAPAQAARTASDLRRTNGSVLEPSATSICQDRTHN